MAIELITTPNLSLASAHQRAASAPPASCARCAVERRPCHRDAPGDPWATHGVKPRDSRVAPENKGVLEGRKP